MRKQTRYSKKYRLLLLLVIGGMVLCLPKAFQHTSSAAGTPHKVHIAFGFHVNLYHSFRGDTNDENGYGQDIRVIRHTIGELDRFNRQGIPVSAVWDFDNLFSLEEILPAHAPDIIRNVQRRVRENKDDVILMSYNNGMVSAMNHREFMTAIQMGISNGKGSGVRDLFGRVVPVVRPQEMMTTPGNFERYRTLGIDVVSLYYSATPFDAFRVFSRELTPAESYNPIQYNNPTTGEQIVILPTYHAGDLVEHVSLRDWAETLHKHQIEGKIDRDVLIFINFDADAEFWTGADLPWHLNWLPNTGGISQLVDSVADLDFVAFSNLSDYLAAHPPRGSVHFGQDTADGSFHGYNSWAEKAYASEYWTRIVRNRQAEQVANKVFAGAGDNAMPSELAALLQAAFDTRMRAMSTTNFGLATPFLARQREAAMADLLDRLDGYTDRIQAQVRAHAEKMIALATPPDVPPTKGYRVASFMHIDRGTGGDRHIGLTLASADAARGPYFLADHDGRIIPATLVKILHHPKKPQATVTLRVSRHHEMHNGLYFLYRRAENPPTPIKPAGRVFAGTRILKNGHIEIRFDDNGHVSQVTGNGAMQLDAHSLVPYMVHQGKRYAPKRLTVTPQQTGDDGIAAVRVSGTWDGPAGATRAPGWVDYRLRLLRGIPYLFIEGEVRYPDTYRRHVVQVDKPMLARKIDTRWEAVAPVELRFAVRANKDHPFVIHKRNFFAKEDAYAVDYFRHSSENLNVDSINNHITSEYTGVTANGRGMAVAMNTEVNANFAFCPFQMAHHPEANDFTIRANPFGTYDGDQITPPTRGNRQGYEAVLLSAPQLHSAGPTYNGYHDRFDLMVSFFDGDAIPEDVKQDLIAFARRPAAIGLQHMEPQPTVAAAPLPPAGFLALPYQDGFIFHWEDVGEGRRQYRIRCRSTSTPGERVFSASGSTLFVHAARLSGTGGQFWASIEAVLADGNVSARSPEIQFQFKNETGGGLKIPIDFKAKVLWANVSAWIQRYLL